MIHGIQNIELTYDSVREALYDYLKKHVDAGVALSVESWEIAEQESYSGGAKTIKVKFTQVVPKEGAHVHD